MLVIMALTDCDKIQLVNLELQMLKIGVYNSSFINAIQNLSNFWCITLLYITVCLISYTYWTHCIPFYFDTKHRKLLYCGLIHCSFHVFVIFYTGLHFIAWMSLHCSSQYEIIVFLSFHFLPFQSHFICWMSVSTRICQNWGGT